MMQHLDFLKETKCSLVTISDEFDNYFNFEIIPRCQETHDYMVPILTDCVMRSLLFGPARDDNFQFCSDDARRDKNLPQYVFDYLIDELNDGYTKFESAL